MATVALDTVAVGTVEVEVAEELAGLQLELVLVAATSGRKASGVRAARSQRGTRRRTGAEVVPGEVDVGGMDSPCIV
jgi:hypothetical protein